MCVSSSPSICYLTKNSLQPTSAIIVSVPLLLCLSVCLSVPVSQFTGSSPATSCRVYEDTKAEVTVTEYIDLTFVHDHSYLEHLLLLLFLYSSSPLLLLYPLFLPFLSVFLHVPVFHLLLPPLLSLPPLFNLQLLDGACARSTDRPTLISNSRLLRPPCMAATLQSQY